VGCNVDPQATWERWLRAIEANDEDEAREAAEDLLGWLRAGGFKPPRWQGNPDSEHVFHQWCEAFLTA
jgi:hypothetical protein